MTTMTRNMNRMLCLALILATQFPSPVRAQNPIQKFFSSDVDTKVSRAPHRDTLPPYDGPRHTIAVAGFENYSGSHQRDLGKNLKFMLESALTQSGRFDVLNRTTLDSVMSEQGLAGSGLADNSDRLAQAGRLAVARYAAEGVITMVEDGQSSRNIGFGYKGIGIGLGGGGAAIGLQVKLTDTTTGRIIAQRDITGKAKGQAFNIGVQRDFGLQYGQAKHAPIEQAAQDCITQVVEFIALEIASKGNAETAQLGNARVAKVDAANQLVVIDKGSSHGLLVGQRLEVPGKVDEFGFNAPSDVTVVEVIALREAHAQCRILSGAMPQPQAAVTLAQAR